MNLLPAHGKIDCHDCFSGDQLQTSPHPKWLMRNDPAAWGSEKPKILILGFSKGATQTDIYKNKANKKQRTHLTKLRDVEFEHISSILKQTGGRIRGTNGAAEILDIKPTTLESRMIRLGIKHPA